MGNLSKRLQTVAGLVTSAGVIADIGTDHAYIPIYLLEEKRAVRAIAMDVNRGPLERAKEHVREAKLEELVDLRLSDGLERLNPGEADSVIIAGMGGGLVIRILEAGDKRAGAAHLAREYILQPQSELEKVREYLLGAGYRFVQEEMVLDEGKYYPMMRVLPPKSVSARQEGESGGESSGGSCRHNRDEENCENCWDRTKLRYGKLLLERRHPVLRQYLEREQRIKREIFRDLQRRLDGGDEEKVHILRRLEELEEELDVIGKGLDYYELRRDYEAD